MHAVGARGARNQIHQVLEIAIVTQGQVGHLLGFHLLHNVRAVRLQNRNFGGDYHRFAVGAGLEDRVNSNIAVHQDIDPGSDGFLEAISFDRYLILSRRKIGEFIVSVFVCRG